MARNHSRRGKWVEAKMVPAVSEVCSRQALHWNNLRVVTSLYVRPPQAGHSKPFGQREAITTARHFSSVPYSSSNAASLSPFWNCTLWRAMAAPPRRSVAVEPATQSRLSEEGKQKSRLQT